MSDDSPIQFLNHGICIPLIARDPSIRIRVTERWVRAIAIDLGKAGYLTSIREGRRIPYVIHGEGSLTLAGVSAVKVAALLAALP